MILSCSKKFSDGSTRKVQIYTISDGLLIGFVDFPVISNYTPSINDTIAVQLIASGLRVAYMINGVGILMECVEYRNNIGFRVSIN